jgi:hypothetical protein
MWEKVSSRSHQPLKIFPFGEGSGEMMLYGVVDYVMKDGEKAGVDWAARGQLVKENGKVKWDYYQVYLVSFFGFDHRIKQGTDVCVVGYCSTKLCKVIVYCTRD